MNLTHLVAFKFFDGASSIAQATYVEKVTKTTIFHLAATKTTIFHPAVTKTAELE